MPDNLPEFGQLVEYITEGPVIHAVALEQHSLDVLPVLEAVAEDYQKVEGLGRGGALPPGEVATLRGALAESYHSDVVRYATDATASPGSIVATLAEVKARPDWRAGLAVQTGQVYGFEGNLYEVIQAHTTQGDWLPNVSFALFKRFYEPADDPWPWRQPQGAHDRYRLGARVLHNGFTWRSENDANVWEPGSVGAESLWTNLTPPPATPEWAVGVAYHVGDEVVHQGSTYRCRQAHTSILSWAPGPATAALWLKL